MDFVMSRIGLSVCALISVSVLGAAFAEHELDDKRQELRTAVQRLCDTMSAAALGYGDSVTTYTVPWLSTGEAIQATVTTDGTVMSTGALSEVDHPCTQIHLWRWDGNELNNSVIAQMDAACGGFTASSGASLDIVGMSLMVDGTPRMLVFVLPAEPGTKAQNLTDISSTARASASISAEVL
jgi:hypothetical protein